MPKDWKGLSPEEYEKERQFYLERKQLYCVTCESLIPVGRILLGASTCSPDCAKISKQVRRVLKTLHRRQCLNCGRPWTPEFEAAFRLAKKQLGIHRGRPAGEKPSEGMLEAQPENLLEAEPQEAANE